MSADGLFQRLAQRLDESESAFVMADMLDLSAAEVTVLRHVMRRADPATATELTDEIRTATTLSDGEIGAALEGLAAREAIVLRDERVHMASIAATRRVTPGGIWDRLGGL